MKISYNWLKNYITISESPKEVANLLTQSGLEVTEISIFESIKGSLSGLIIGQIVSCEQHPNANKLKITQVNVGQSVPLRIVCGASNVQVGQKVIVAPVGAQLYNQKGVAQKIKEAKIRGELSEGMICAEDEIGLEKGYDGIAVLDTPLKPGTPAAQHFNIQSDNILEIDLTPNRADACSHLGTAKELGALLDRSVQYPFVKEFDTATLNLPIQVVILDHSKCPRYSGITISGVNVQPSPPWLRDKLKAIGLNPVNNIVDVTNFVLHELGQPLHAFDYDQIVGNKIIIQQSTPGTPFVGLDGTTRRLNGAELMVCDQVGDISLAGILGSKRASVHKGTKNIFLESAYFAPSAIRATAKQHTITTDASFRYERGTNPNITVYALKRAYSLLQEIAQGKIASELIDLYPEKVLDHKIKIYYKNITKLLGLNISKETIRQILDRLEITTYHEEEGSFVASVPPYRVDILREVDVIEEIIRIHGYDKIKVTGKLGSAYLARPSRHEQHKLQHSIATLLAANGYHEIYTNALTKSSYAELTNAFHKQERVIVSNPLSESLSVLKQTLLFAGLETMAHNINRKQPNLRLFEFGKTYHKKDEQYIENKRLGIWLTGNVEDVNWARKPQGVTFQDIYAIIDKVLRKLNLTNFSMQPYASSLYQIGVQIVLDHTQLLTAGKVHPLVLKYMGINQPIFFTDIDWEVLLHKWRPTCQYEETSKFPSVKRDISLVLDQSVNFEDVKRTIAQQKNKLVKSVTVVDVYQGKALGERKKAYTLRFLLQRKDKTLDEKTTNQVMQRLTQAFESQLQATIRT